MYKFVNVILACTLILLSIAFQPSTVVDAQTTTCLAQGCKTFLPLIMNGTATTNPMRLCLVTDTGGIDDHGFNASAWQAHTDAAKNYGATVKYLESLTQTDFQTNIETFINEGCDLITTVGFLMTDVTKLAAEAHPTQKFTIADVDFEPAIANIVDQTYSVDQPAFMSGYLAAGMTTTGKVGTFGGYPIPTVTIFMDGFARGVAYYNALNGTTVEVLGWNISDPTAGLFSMSFDDQIKGKELGNTLMDQGADIIFPVAGPVGLGTAAAVKERGNGYLIGVDTDWVLTSPDYADIILTSVMKVPRGTTFGVIKNLFEGTFVGGDNFRGTLANQGVNLGTIHSAVPSALLTEVDQVKAGIIAGTIMIKPMQLCLVTDTGGIDDRSFNAAAWQGVQDAVTNLGARGSYLESQTTGDYTTNIEAFVAQDCDLIITVGFFMADALLSVAEAHPDQKFTVVDFKYDPILSNVAGQIFSTEQAAFLSGYMAAGTTVTGKVATFGGFPIPSVTAFMQGYAQGVNYYNTQHGTTIQVVGWDTQTQTGLFTWSFDDPVLGYNLANQLLTTDGVDIILPVAGPVGLGAAQAVFEHGNSWIIGVDSDWAITNPDYSSIILTSVMKNIRATTYGVILNVHNQTFAGGDFYGNLANQGVGLGTVASSVSSGLLAEIEQVKASIISGAITVYP